MALLDSRRSIAEAQSVTKLTELAFFFIPLTFAASLFGMQIEQLKDPAPMSTFILLAVLFTAVSYLFRLIIRSQWLRNLRTHYETSIKRHASEKRVPFRKGQIPASLFLSWISSRTYGFFRVTATEKSRKMGNATSKAASSFWDTTGWIINCILMVPCLSVPPVAVIWTCPLNHGIKSLITIVVLVLVSIVAWLYWTHSDRRGGMTFLRMLKTKLPSQKRRKLVPPLLAILIIVMSVSILSVIWTRPIAPGIRAAVTIVFVLAILMCVVFYLLQKLVNAASRKMIRGAPAA
jgi:hypothetical protein